MMAGRGKLLLACVHFVVFSGIASAHGIALRDVGEAAPGTIEIRGLGAGDFSPRSWKAGTLHLLPDARHPVLAPREGKFRNIYAPSIVQIDDGFRIFYGGWDGVPSGNDRIYTATTTDFAYFADRHTLIEHGVFQHVCNVSAVRSGDDSFALMCTAYPVANGTNKPAFFQLSDLNTPHVASMSDLIDIRDYKKFETADINGMNVLLLDGDVFRLYFGSFKDFGRVFRATSRDGKAFVFDGVALKPATAPNDVKRFHVGSQSWYLMGLHMNGPALSYALSKDGMSFDTPQELLSHRDESDRYIVAVGFVTSGEQKLLGLLYGAGAKASLDANRLFARWLQKRLVITEPNGKKTEPAEAIGPQCGMIRSKSSIKGAVELFDDDGITPIGKLTELTLRPGRAYVLTQTN